MKKAAKRIICMLSAICVAVSMLLVCDTPVLAATAPAKVHIGLKNTRVIHVKFSEGDYKIQNVKCSSKNAIPRVTNVSANVPKIISNEPWGYGEINLYTEKKGTYIVTFDVVDKNMNVTSSHSVKVYANNEVGVKKVTFAGKPEMYRVMQDGKGTFKVTMNKGYTLKSITMVTYNKSGKEVRKKIKNGAKVTLGKYRCKNMIGSSNWRADLLAQTEFAIEYKDKYTGESRWSYAVYYCFPKN